MFLGLGFVNARRNLSRSAVALIGVALAAAVFTASLSLGAGYPAGAGLEYRFVLGGDLLIFPARYWFWDRRERVTLQKAGADLAFPLAYFHPAAFTRGFLAPPGMPGLIDPGDLDVLVAGGKLAGGEPARPGQDLLGRGLRGRDLPWRGLTEQDLQGVMPYWVLPARVFRQVVDEQGRPALAGGPIVLRGREVEKDLAWWPCEEMLDEGRYFRPEDEGRPVALVFAGAGYVGHTVTVRVPALRREGGELRVDDRGGRDFVLEVVGVLRTPRRLVTVSGEGQGPVTRPVSWRPGEIWIPARTLAEIYRQVAGAELDWAPAAAVRLRSVAYLEEVARALGRQDPRWVAVSVPRLLQEGTGGDLVLPEDWRRGLVGLAHAGAEGLRAVARGTVVPGPPAQPVVPVDPGRMGVYLMFGVAGMLVAINMLVLVTGRQEEMGVLRALGAHGHEVVAMVLGECLAVSLLGGGVGFGFIHLLGAWNLVSNRMPWLEVATRTLDNLGRVLVLCGLMAVAFGLIPAWRALRRSPVDLLKGL
ncbi:MAG: ABC transporter permease [Firmicutes bacterium]|nr:ABC transporter permease [Bacillota bacterium]